MPLNTASFSNKQEISRKLHGKQLMFKKTTIKEKKNIDFMVKNKRKTTFSANKTSLNCPNND